MPRLAGVGHGCRGSGHSLSRDARLSLQQDYLESVSALVSRCAGSIVSQRGISLLTPQATPNIAGVFPASVGGMRQMLMIYSRSAEEKVRKEIMAKSVLDAIRRLRRHPKR